jgi:hypothetical protein
VKLTCTFSLISRFKMSGVTPLFSTIRLLHGHRHVTYFKEMEWIPGKKLVHLTRSCAEPRGVLHAAFNKGNSICCVQINPAILHVKSYLDLRFFYLGHRTSVPTSCFRYTYIVETYPAKCHHCRI